MGCEVCRTTSKEDVDSVVGDANLTTGSNEAMAAYTAAISNTLTKKLKVARAWNAAKKAYAGVNNKKEI